MNLGTPRDAVPRGPWWSHLYVQVLTAIFAGVLLGHYFPDVGVALKPLGDGFINLVKMIIAPVIFLTVATGIASVGEAKTLGRLTVKTFAYFLFFSTLALIVGLIVANLVQPGAGMNIDPATLDAGGRVVFGCTVDLEDEASGQRVTYQIVGDDEADLKLGLISISSPIARALIGKEAGDVADVQAPGGLKSYEVIEVRYQ